MSISQLISRLDDLIQFKTEYEPEETAHITDYTGKRPRHMEVDVGKLINRLKSRPVKKVPLDELYGTRHEGPPSKSPRDGFSRKRMEATDTRYPLIINKENYVINGRHRWWKLKEQGKKHAKVVRATDKDLKAVKLIALLDDLIEFAPKWEKVMRGLAPGKQESMIRKMAYNIGKPYIGDDSPRLLAHILHPETINPSDLPLARMRLKESVRDRNYKSIIGMKGSLSDPNADVPWRKRRVLKYDRKRQPTFAEARGEHPDELMDFTHGGGEQHIRDFLSGKSKGYALEGEGRIGIQVHPHKGEPSIGILDRSYYYANKSAAMHHDRPALLTGKIRKGDLVTANNSYEGAIIDPAHIKNPVVRGVRKESGELPYLTPEDLSHRKPIRKGTKLSAVLDDLIQFKTLYQPRKEDEPPGSLPVFKQGAIVDYNVQRHHAKRAGLHRDVRIGDRRRGLLSWATRKEGPDPGKPIAIHQQSTHPHSYLGWSGNIPPGYGEGNVKSEELRKALVTKSSSDELHATLSGEKGSHRVAFVKTKRGWLFSKGKAPQPPAEAQKPPAKSLEPKEAKEYLKDLPEGSSVQPKIDGALIYVTTKGGRPEIFSHRVSKTTGEHPVHTERVFRGRPTVDIPREHQRTLIGELYGKIRGKAIPPQDLGGLLNAHIHESIRKQRASGVKLKVMPFDVVGEKGSYPERLSKLKETLRHLPKDVFHAPEQAESPGAALRLYDKIRSGRHPLTREGLIVHPYKGKMVKIKETEEANVKIAGTFPGTGKFEGHPGGFYYADKSGKPVGRVGTGFSDESRRELGRYIGRTARIKHQGRYESGAYRAPSFIAIDEAR